LKYNKRSICEIIGTTLSALPLTKNIFTDKYGTPISHIDNTNTQHKATVDSTFLHTDMNIINADNTINISSLHSISVPTTSPPTSQPKATRVTTTSVVPSTHALAITSSHVPYCHTLFLLSEDDSKLPQNYEEEHTNEDIKHPHLPPWKHVGKVKNRVVKQSSLLNYSTSVHNNSFQNDDTITCEPIMCLTTSVDQRFDYTAPIYDTDSTSNTSTYMNTAFVNPIPRHIARYTPNANKICSFDTTGHLTGRKMQSENNTRTMNKTNSNTIVSSKYSITDNSNALYLQFKINDYEHKSASLPTHCATNSIEHQVQVNELVELASLSNNKDDYDSFFHENLKRPSLAHTIYHAYAYDNTTDSYSPPRTTNREKTTNGTMKDHTARNTPPNVHATLGFLQKLQCHITIQALLSTMMVHHAHADDTYTLHSTRTELPISITAW